jgi:hypothetical protein
MYKMTILLVSIILATAACSRGITRDTYIDTMVELGCNQMTEGNSRTAEVYERRDVSMKDLSKFRRGLKPKESAEVARVIQQKTVECINARVGARTAQ